MHVNNLSDFQNIYAHCTKYSCVLLEDQNLFSVLSDLLVRENVGFRQLLFSLATLKNKMKQRTQQTQILWILEQGGIFKIFVSERVSLVLHPYFTAIILVWVCLISQSLLLCILNEFLNNINRRKFLCHLSSVGKEHCWSNNHIHDSWVSPPGIHGFFWWQTLRKCFLIKFRCYFMHIVFFLSIYFLQIFQTYSALKL